VSLFDQMTRTAAELTLRGITMATQMSSVAVRSMVRAVPPDLADQVRRALAEPLEALLDLPEAVHDSTGFPIPRQAIDTANVMRTLVAPGEVSASDEELVRRRFDELIARSTDVDDRPGLPAFLEVIAQLTPDEARILRWLSDQGSAPVLDLEAVSLVGRGTRTVLANQTLVAERAGCVTVDDVDTYLSNLARLGIVAFSDEELAEHDDYQLIEGTAVYRAALRQYRDERLWRTRSRRRSLRLTPFGHRFLTVCTGRERPDPSAQLPHSTSARSRGASEGASGE
jgi:hypothetical protein